jgi:hypothetical protein
VPSRHYWHGNGIFGPKGCQGGLLRNAVGSSQRNFTSSMETSVLLCARPRQRRVTRCDPPCGALERMFKLGLTCEKARPISESTRTIPTETRRPWATGC